MTVAALRVELEREEAVWGLTMMRRAERWERWETAEALVRAELPAGVRMRMPLALMPGWYRNLWWDATQIDGRVELDDINHLTVKLRGVSPGTTDLQTVYTIATTDFLDAVLSGAIGDAS